MHTWPCVCLAVCRGAAGHGRGSTRARPKARVCPAHSSPPPAPPPRAHPPPALLAGPHLRGAARGTVRRICAHRLHSRGCPVALIAPVAHLAYVAKPEGEHVLSVRDHQRELFAARGQRAADVPRAQRRDERRQEHVRASGSAGGPARSLARSLAGWCGQPELPARVGAESVPARQEASCDPPTRGCRAVSGGSPLQGRTRCSRGPMGTRCCPVLSEQIELGIQR